VTSTADPVGSGTAQARKLGLKPGIRVLLDCPPAGWAITAPPADLDYVAADEPADVVLAFFADAAALANRLPRLVQLVYPAGAVWVMWPRRAGGHESDITDNVVRGVALPLGVVDVLVAAIDTDWSGLRLVWRVSRRPEPGEGW
jgi:hypothetical protein